MFSLMLFGGIAVVGLLFIALGRRKREADMYRMDTIIALYVIGTIIIIIGAIALMVAVMRPYTLQIEDAVAVKAMEKKIMLYTARKDNLIAVVRAELEKYPKYEKAIMSGIKPQILLSFPELKSNSTMLETVKQIVALENDVYKLRAEQIDIQQWMYYREISPWTLWAKSYKNLLGADNPVSL